MTSTQETRMVDLNVQVGQTKYKYKMIKGMSLTNISLTEISKDKPTNIKQIEVLHVRKTIGIYVVQNGQLKHTN